MNAYELAYKLNNALGVDYEMLEQSSIMLRQQADRIAELEKYVGFKESGYDIIQLTPQTKPLSNNEILEMTIWNKNLYELYVEMEKEDMIAFARAIEERHGIK